MNNSNNNIAQSSKFPKVRCKVEGHPDAPGYVVCVHVAAGTAPSNFVKATGKALGQIMCNVPTHANTEMVLMCPRCCVVAGYIDPLLA